MSDFVLTGFVDVDDDGLVPFEIRSQLDGGYAVWQEGDLRDDIDDVCEFIAEVGGVYYATKADFKKDNAADLSLVILRHALHSEVPQ
jgi:hypothetical protein